MLGAGGIGDSLANLVLTVSGASSIATLTFQQATARIVGSSTNGLAIRNSANTRDNFIIVDSGTTATLTDGTNIASMAASGASGELTAGARYRGTGGTWLNETSGVAGDKIGVSYFDGTIYRSALEVANVASGFGALTLMKSGGTVQIAGNVVNSLRVTVSGSNVTTTGQTAASVTGLSFAIAANEVWVCRVHMKVGSSSATGLQVAVSFPAAATVTADWLGNTLTNPAMAWEQTTASGTLTTTSFDTLAATTAGIGAFVNGEITVANGANAGTVQIQFAKTTSGTATVYIGSFLTAHRIA